jgi:RimJ/RimL family protein N-acetyltransferase
VFHRSARLFLRPAFPEDSAAIRAAIATPEILRNLARAPWPCGMAQAQDLAGPPQDPRLPHFLVTLPGAGVIGSASLAEHEGVPEITFWIAREHWGKGYATEAAGAVLKIARTLGHRRIMAGHFVDNPASGKVLRKLGFCPTGRVGQRFSAARGAWVDWLEYAIDLGAGIDPAPFARAA